MTQTCPYRGESVCFVDRTNAVTPTDHHNNIGKCGECSWEVVGG